MAVLVGKWGLTAAPALSAVQPMRMYPTPSPADASLVPPAVAVVGGDERGVGMTGGEGVRAGTTTPRLKVTADREPGRADARDAPEDDAARNDAKPTGIANQEDRGGLLDGDARENVECMLDVSRRRSVVMCGMRNDECAVDMMAAHEDVDAGFGLLRLRERSVRRDAWHHGDDGGD